MAAPMLKSDSYREREKGMFLDRLVSAFRFAYLSPLGWLWIYKVYCSQFKVCKDFLLLDEIFLAFIEIDIEGNGYQGLSHFPI